MADMTASGDQNGTGTGFLDALGQTLNGGLSMALAKKFAPQPTTQPRTLSTGNSGTLMLVIGGALVLVLVLVLAFRKG